MKRSTLYLLIVGLVLAGTKFSLAQLPLNANGWTKLTPSVDTRKIFVSNSVGNDANDGLSRQTPKKTIAAGLSLLRDGYPDWLLLKRGDEWNETFGVFKKEGRSATEPIVIGAYGQLCQPRPLIKTGSANGFATQGNISDPVGNFVITGLHFYANTRDPQSPDFVQSTIPNTVGIRILCPGENILVEDCYLDFFGGNMVVQAIEGMSTIKNFKLRRCILTNSYSVNSHSQGIYAEKVDGLLIEENLFDHNGWHDTIAGAGPTIYNHNLYLQCYDSNSCNLNVTVRNNIMARAASHGLQLRPGGIADNNLFLQNALAMFNGRPFASRTTNNVVLDARDINSTNPRGMGIEIKRNPDAIVENNIVAHKMNPNVYPGYAYNLFYQSSDVWEVDQSHIEFRNNIAYNWKGEALKVNNNMPSGDVTIIEDNEFQNLTGNYMVKHDGTSVPSGYTYRNNTYYTTAQSNRWFRVGSVEYSLPGWITISGETGAVASQISYTDPNRDITTYQALLGGTPTLEAFLSEAKKQSKCTWRKEYTANKVNNYIRAGFVKTNLLGIDLVQAPDNTGMEARTISGGVSNEINNNTLNVYPNPAREVIQVDLSSLTGYTNTTPVIIQLFNVLGEQVGYVQTDFNSARYFRMNLDDNRVSGLYLMRITVGDEVFTKNIQVVN